MGGIEGYSWLWYLLAMRKYLLLTLLGLGCAGFANATIVFVSPCTVLEGPNSGPTLSSTCSATADAGFFLSSVTLTLTSDYTGLVSGSPTVTDTYTFATNTAGFGAIPNGVVTTSGTGSVANLNFNVTLTGNFGSTINESFNMSNTPEPPGS